jgi:hypothetical protein
MLSQIKYNISPIIHYSYFGVKMHLETLSQKLASLNINPDEIEYEQYAKAFIILFAIVKMLSEEIVTLKAEIQMLRDAINLLKGEQTKPNIRGSKKNDDVSSEYERNQRKPQKNRESNSRIDKLEIHQTETCKADKSTLPKDAVFKGYGSVVIRDIIMKPLNTKYKIELFYLNFLMCREHTIPQSLRIRLFECMYPLRRRNIDIVIPISID